MAKKLFDNEREAWDHIHGPHNAKKRKRFRRFFWELFPEGHKTSIRRFVAELVLPERQEEIKRLDQARYLRSIHPRALDILLKYGMDYTPRLWGKPPSFGEPISGGCHVNAWKLMTIHNDRCDKHSPSCRLHERPSMVYVEGITIGPTTRPMLHAWNAFSLNGERAIDWTFYSHCHWNRYFGIPFSKQEYDKACSIARPRKPTIILLFRKQYFPRVESYLQNLLAIRLEKRLAAKCL